MFALIQVTGGNYGKRFKVRHMGSYETMDAAKRMADKDALEKYGVVTHWNETSEMSDYTQDVSDGVYYAVREV